MNIFYTIIEKQCLANEDTQFLQLSKMETKFQTLIHIQNNLFIMPKIKKLIFDLFYKAQRCYYALSRFSRIYLLRKAKIPVENDLYLNPIDKNYRKSIQLYDRSTRSLYYFTLSDLVRIINTSLTHSRNFFMEPLECKNPYTNTPFTKSMLYTIYFHIQKNYPVIPPLLQAYFIDNFDLELFSIHNEQLIRNISVDSFLKNSSTEILYYEVIHMLSLLKLKINISNEFPKDVLVDVMYPYLYLYCRYMYSVQGTECRYIYYTILRKKMMEFRDYNPQFGRKMISISSGSERKIKINFNSDSPRLTIQNINEIIGKKIYRLWYSYGWIVPSNYTAQSARYSGYSFSLYRTDVDSDPDDDIYQDEVMTQRTVETLSNMNNRHIRDNTQHLEDDDDDDDSRENDVIIQSESEESEEMDFDY